MYPCTCTPRHRVQRTIVQDYNKDMCVLINPKEDFSQKSAAFIGSKGSWWSHRKRSVLISNKQPKWEFRTPSGRQAALGSGEVLMSSPASCSWPASSQRKTQGPASRGAPARGLQRPGMQRGFLGSYHLHAPKSFVSLLFIFTRGSKEPACSGNSSLHSFLICLLV